MTCTHCGRHSIPGTLTLRFSPSGREPLAVDLLLCGDCLGELLTDPDVDLVKPALVYLTDAPGPSSSV